MLKDLAIRKYNYLRMAPLPYFVLGVCLVLVVELAYIAAEFYSYGQSLGFMAAAATALSLTTGAFFSVADILSRHREYLRIRKMLVDNGYSEKIFKAVAASRCQRDAALWAAKQAGYGMMAKKVYRSMGYRWYHVIPDMLVKNPFRLFTPKFLRTAFWAGKRGK